MTVMRFTIIDKDDTVSFVAPWNTLKALVAGCSAKPAPESVENLLENASKYDARIKDYVSNGLSAFDEHHNTGTQTEEIGQLNPTLQAQLRSILEERSYSEPTSQVSEETPPEVSFEDLEAYQRSLSGSKLASHPVLRVIDEATRNQSLEPVKAGLVIFNLTARRIIQVQNSFGILQRSDRGRYFENGQPTDRLYFYRLPSDWSMVP